MKTLIENKAVRLLLSTLVCVCMFVSCSNDLSTQEMDNLTTPKRRLPQVSYDYGEAHNYMLDLCLEACNDINPTDYMVESADDENFYALYAAYSDVITQLACEYLDIHGGDHTMIPNQYDGYAINTPQAFFSYRNAQREAMEQNWLAGGMALHLIETALENHISTINDYIEDDPYWMNLTDSIEIYAENIYAECEPYCESEDDRQYLEAMLSIMIGSFNYWSDTSRMAAWRNLAWNANCHYLNLNNMEETEFEHFYAQYCNSTKQQVKNFVLTDLAFGISGMPFGPYCAVALAFFASGCEAWSWD
ncbi:MAG: hypothetical protein IJ249_06945 [Paludibacteraceae bacterium]|nr:hypothetical protein [Paludibacteraceae bacterium]